MTTRVVRRADLHWEQRPLPTNWRDAKAIIEDLDHNNQNKLIYAIQGFHNAFPVKCVLYLGMSNKNKDRPVTSVKQRFYKDRLWGAYRDISIHVASIKTSSNISTKSIEKLLIIAHKPPLNSKLVDGVPTVQETNILILNLHEKGVILPVLFGDYHFIDIGEENGMSKL